MQVFFDRRNQRSDSRREALSLQLQASARRAGAEAMVLADHDGRIIARSDRATAADELAAFTPFLAKPKLWFGEVRVGGRARRVAVTPIKLGAKTAYLCAVGADKRTIGGVFLQTTAGVRRIMRV